MFDFYRGPLTPAFVPLALGAALAGGCLVTLCLRRYFGCGRAWALLAAAPGALALAAVCEWAARLGLGGTAGLTVRIWLCVAAIAALVELPEHWPALQAAWRLPRWTHLAAGAIALGACLPRCSPWADLACRLMLAYQGSVLALAGLRSPGLRAKTDSERGRLALAAGVVAGVVAQTFGLGIVALPAFAAAATGAWLEAAELLLPPGPRRKLIVWGAPLVVTCAVGLLSAALHDRIAADRAAQVAAAAADDDPLEGSAAERLASHQTPSIAWNRSASQIGIAVVPIVLLVGAIWGLSRLPFAH